MTAQYLTISAQRPAANSTGFDLTIKPEPWVADALCAETDPEAFFNDGKGVSYARAKAICAACPVVQDCGEYAIRNGIEDGVYGGLSPNERARMRRAGNQ